METTINKNENSVLSFYTPSENEKLILIQNLTAYSYKVYAVYVNGEYDRKIKIKKY